MASRMTSGALTITRTSSPVHCRRSSTMSGFRGSAVATVSTPPSTLTGHTTYWRRYFDETLGTTGSGDGSSSRERKASFRWRASARATSSAEAAPTATRASPIFSRVVTTRASAASTTSAVTTPSSMRISPSSGVEVAMAMLCSGVPMLAYLGFAAVAAAADVAGALIVTATHRKGGAPLRYFVAAGAGFMLAAAFVRMLPESAGVPHAFLFVLLGYFGVHLFEHTVAPHFHFGEEIHTEALLSPAAGYLALLGLSVHTLFDGVAIAAGFMIGPTLGFLLFIAVLLHKLPEGFTIASVTLAAGRSRAAALGAATTLGVMTLLGAVGTSALATRHVPYALALSAGVTLYVAASDLIPEVNREGGPALAWTVFGGLVLFGLVDWALSVLVSP